MKNTMRFSRARLSLVLLTALGGYALPSCSTTPYYAMMEKFGVEKRDILVDRVAEAREDQTEAKEQFQTTLEAFKALTGFDGAELEDVYNKLSKELKRSESAASSVTSRIESIEAVAEDMFSEWSQENEQYSDASLKRSSEQMLRDTRSQYGDLLNSMKNAESKMEPVLQKFRDRVTFLKHNLNASAIGSLQNDLSAIEGDVQGLIREMQESIDEADTFIDSMNPEA
ncbi:MAG: DUF2959 domain-containing protein [Planctomycetota bacterium]